MKAPVNAILARRLKPLYVAAFLQGFVFYYAIEKVFMKSIGINDAGIAVIIVLFTAVMMVANLPIGILADRWSRRGVLMLSSLFLILSIIVEGMSVNFWQYLLGCCLWGISYACYLGTYDSVVYDTLVEETGKADAFEYYYGKVQFYDGAALVISSLLCAVIVHYVSFRAAYFFCLPFSLLSLVALLRFKEPLLHKESVRDVLSVHIRETLHAVLRRKELVWFMLSLMLITVASRLMLEFDQLWLIALAMPAVWYGPVNALLLAAYGGSGMVANLLKNRLFMIMSVGIVMVLASACLLFHVLPLTIVALFLIIAGFIVIEIIINRWLHDMLPSKVRAGASSTVTTLGYGIFLPVGLLFGYASQHWTVFQASWVAVAVCAAIACSVIMAGRTAVRHQLVQ